MKKIPFLFCKVYFSGDVALINFSRYLTFRKRQQHRKETSADGHASRCAIIVVGGTSVNQVIFLLIEFGKIVV